MLYLWREISEGYGVVLYLTSVICKSKLLYHNKVKIDALYPCYILQRNYFQVENQAKGHNKYITKTYSL